RTGPQEHLGLSIGAGGGRHTRSERTLDALLRRVSSRPGVSVRSESILVVSRISTSSMRFFSRSRRTTSSLDSRVGRARKPEISVILSSAPRPDTPSAPGRRGGVMKSNEAVRTTLGYPDQGLDHAVSLRRSV